VALIPKPKFPNVPKLPGVPQLARSNLFPAALPPIINLGLALAKLWQSIFAVPQWAIYKAIPPPAPDPQELEDARNGIDTVHVVAKRQPVVKPDSFGEFSYRNEWSVADFPMQDGAFASYDKVNNPFEIMVRMYKGGTKRDRADFLASIDAIAGTLDFYDILTPERTYLNVNVVRYEVSRRGPGGAYFLSEVDLYFREIRTVKATYSTTSTVTQNAQNPSAQPVDNAGTVQAQPVAIETGEP
jgi:hypothetical protein